MFSSMHFYVIIRFILSHDIYKLLWCCWCFLLLLNVKAFNFLFFFFITKLLRENYFVLRFNDHQHHSFVVQLQLQRTLMLCCDLQAIWNFNLLSSLYCHDGSLVRQRHFPSLQAQSFINFSAQKEISVIFPRAQCRLGNCEPWHNILRALFKPHRPFSCTREFDVKAQKFS